MTKDIDLRPYRIELAQAENLAREFFGVATGWGDEAGKATAIRIRFGDGPEGDSQTLYAEFKHALGCYLPR